ncbi:oxygenase MpaB family protein [Terrabacter aeriphilus]|uniref:Oxygenase MpaB family protein n=1 Tax=Terrabacter aeriphilus TaxID=515662 RepID=A0ABP9J340_9MICO
MTVHAAPRLVQRQLGRLLRSKVAGDDAPARAQRIWGAEGERWFTPTDPVWRVHADASMFPGGVTSLLLQMLHPMAMAGVAGHSGYKSDPWGRLQRTSHYLATTTFGTIEHAEESIAMVRSIHERVRGKDAFGRPYRADDPRLLMWVHVAEIDSFLRAYQTFGEEPLTDEEADVYVRQAGIPAARLGVVDPPQTVAELREVLQAYRPELETTDAAREAARFLLLDPPLPLLARPGYGVIASGGVSLLPAWARGMLGIPLPEVVTSFVARPLGHLGTAAVRWGMAGLAERRPSDQPTHSPRPPDGNDDLVGVPAAS